MTVIGLVILIVVIGLVAWIVNSYIPIPQPFKTLINVVLIIVAVLVTLSAFGILGSLNTSVPRLR